MNRGEIIRKELEEIAPDIPWQSQDPDFSVPEGYFARITGRMMEKIQVEEAEKLLRKNNIYQVPQDYFYRLPGKVLKRIQPHKVITLPRRRHRHFQLATAAAIAALVALAGLISRPTPPSKISLDDQLAGISDHAIEQYLNAELGSLNTEEIYDYLSFQNRQISITDGFSSADLEEYLDNNVLSTGGY